jgi:hypothetical protein
MKQSCGSGAEFVDRGQQELQKRIRCAFDFAHRLFRHVASRHTKMAQIWVCYILQVWNCGRVRMKRRYLV